MVERISAGFVELDHTADVEMQVWGPDLPQLLEQAALGMNSLAGFSLKPGRRQTQKLELPIVDPETTLVNFLSELLYLAEVENLGFDTFNIEIKGDILIANFIGAPLELQRVHIKAVTYHNLEIKQIPEGLVANVVFDV